MKEQLYKGQYKKILEKNQSIQNTESLIAQIGALCFMGRVEEAESLYLTQKISHMSDRIEARFFLALGLIRTSEYPRARKYLGENLRSIRNVKKNHTALFYIYQGLAFYRYFCGKWDLALLTVQKAYRESLLADFSYGKILSSDLRGHLLVQVTNVDEGIKELFITSQLSRDFGNTSIAEACDISILSYEAQYGLKPEKIIHEIKLKLKGLKSNDTYSKSSLLLELTRQLIIRGQILEVEPLLDEASRLIYMFRNRRQEAVLNLRWAYLSLLSNDLYRALSFTQSSLRSLDLAVDRVIELSALGLQLKIIERLPLQKEKAALIKELKVKSIAYGGSVHKQILNRYSKKHFPYTSNYTGDRINQIINENEPTKIISSGYNLFLYQALNLPFGEKIIHFNIASSEIIFLSSGQIHLLSDLTSTLKKFLENVVNGVTTKEEIIKNVWGYQYHPLRHDPLIYNTVLNLRKRLGSFSEWLETTEKGYRLHPGIQVKVLNTIDKPANIHSVNLSSHLNHRQLNFLKKLKADVFIHVKKYQEQFGVSEITACRDLAMLQREGYVLRVGRARATRYVLNNGVIL
ncbi:MAG: DeoR family transcriptional regulator [Bacteriovoracaceae bacterium]|nr:DeoR family transcriptional regulator [Bacteriovoracaceae bacterium]